MRELAGWRPPPLEAQVAYRARSLDFSLASADMADHNQDAERDEVDRLFRAVS